MAKIDVNPEYSEEMEEIICEPALPQIFNERFQKLLNNDSYLKEVQNTCAKGEGIEFSVENGILTATYDDGIEEDTTEGSE